MPIIPSARSHCTGISVPIEFPNEMDLAANACFCFRMAQNRPPNRIVGITAFIVMFFGLLFGVLIIVGIWTEFDGKHFGKSIATVFVLFFLSVVMHNVVKGYYGLPKDEV